MKIDVNGVTLNYEMSGSGRPLILLHGNGEDHTIFNEGVQQLQDRFTCYAVDSRDHGESSPCPDLHYSDMADDMIAFMDKLDLQNVLFYGFSDGGIIGLLCAMKTDRISALVTSGANTRPEAIVPWFRRVLHIMSRFSHDAKIQLMKNEPDIRENDLRKIHAKTLVLAGTHDLVTEEDSKFIAASIPGAKLIFIKGEGHASYVVHKTGYVKYLIYADTQM